MTKDNRPDKLFAAYGADVQRWPSDMRALAGEATPEAAAEAREIDALLSLASRPPSGDAAMARLMARIDAEAREEKVIAFTALRRPPRPSIFRLAAALPLAASLALGVYFGARGSLDFLLPSALTGGVALSDVPPDDLGGVGEADAYAEESLS